MVVGSYYYRNSNGSGYYNNGNRERYIRLAELYRLKKYIENVIVLSELGYGSYIVYQIVLLIGSCWWAMQMILRRNIKHTITMGKEGRGTQLLEGRSERRTESSGLVE